MSICPGTPEIEVLQASQLTKEEKCQEAFGKAIFRMEGLLEKRGVKGRALETALKRLDEPFAKMTHSLEKKTSHTKNNQFATSCGWLHTSIDNAGFKIIAIARNPRKIKLADSESLSEEDRKWAFREIEVGNSLERLCRLITVAVQERIDKEEIIENLNGIKCVSILFYKGMIFFSCPDIIGKVMSAIPSKF